MPTITEIDISDEEYQDAESESKNNTSTAASTTAKNSAAPDPNEAIVEEIIKQHAGLQINDEYQDAQSDSKNNTSTAASTTTTNSAAVEEIIKQHAGLQINDEGLPIEKDETNDASDKGNEATSPVYLHDDIDENALKEKELSMTPEELEANKEKANTMKLEANDHFKNNNCESAIDIYTEALKICPLSCTKERAVLYGNRAAAKIKMDSKSSALEDCTKALELWPDYVRVILRRAKLYEHEDKLEDALTDYKRVYEMDPGQPEAREAMIRLPPVINERNERLKEEMLGKLKDLGNMILKPFGLSTSNFQMQQDPNSGSYSINFNQNAS